MPGGMRAGEFKYLVARWHFKADLRISPLCYSARAQVQKEIKRAVPEEAAGHLMKRLDRTRRVSSCPRRAAAGTDNLHLHQWSDPAP